MNRIKSFALGALLASYTASPVWALDIADVPLFQSTIVSPNVMLLIDNSGSMDHITWKVGYQDTTAYPAAEGCISSPWEWDGGWVQRTCSNWSALAAGTTYYRSNFLQLDCASDQRKFRYGVTERCLFMPDPVGGDNTRFKGNYLSYLVGQNVSNSDIPTEHRMKVARDVSKSLVVNNSGMRFGVMSFDPADNNDGGKVLAAAGSSVSDITAQIDGLRSETWTPLAEAYYEMTRYYRGLDANYTGDTFTSPIQYRCQKNFGIVVTDGLPTYDTTFPSGDPDGGARIPDWDGVGSGSAEGVQYSDGPGGDESGEGHYLYLDDIAKFAYDTDLRSSGSDAASASFSDPDFLKQNLTTYAVGFSVDNQMLRDAAERGHGEYYTANSAAQLNTVLNRALQSIKNQTSSAAAIAANSTRLDTGTLIYQAKFNSGDWSGELIAYSINTNGTVDTANISGRGWRTGTTLTSTSSRNIYTYTADATTPDGVEFLWANLTPAQQTNLSVANAADGELVVNWLRGGSSGATLSDSEVLRTRTSVLGDIVNSNPAFVGAQNYGYTVPNAPLVANEPADSYQAYLDSKSATGAIKLVMVGANDGMLHAFNAETGSEKFAYVPSSLFKQRTGTPGDTPGLRHLTKRNYTHKYYVDGSIGVGDVYASGWKTYAVGGLGAGGRGIYGLDITSPGSFSASDVLWEITAPDTNDSSNNWNDLGYTYGPPVIARTQDDTWVAIFSNGYDSNTGRAALYIVNATTGAFIKKIVVDTDTTADTTNGLSAPAVMVDANRRITYVYAGDLKGNLWKFDLTNTSSASWDAFKTSGNGSSKVSVPLFTAKNSSNQLQPITSGLEIGSHPTSGGLMIYFGTGKYFENADNTVGSSPQMQSFYGIWDKPTSGGSLNGWEISARSDLQEQRIQYESGDYRTVSKNVPNWASKRGWYLDLGSPSGTGNVAAGERAVSLPLLRAGRIIFTTVIPSADPCLAGGTSWLMELDAFTGGNLAYAVLDVNGDGEFNSADLIACGTGVSCDPAGMRSREGIVNTPAVLSGGPSETKEMGGTSGNIWTVTEKGSSKEGRMSWRQLR